MVTHQDNFLDSAEWRSACGSVAGAKDVLVACVAEHQRTAFLQPPTFVASRAALQQLGHAIASLLAIFGPNAADTILPSDTVTFPTAHGTRSSRLPRSADVLCCVV